LLIFIKATCDFDVVEFDVGNGLVGDGVLGLEIFDETNVWAESRWAYAWGGGTSAG
jgi:hypothetical protein